MRLKRRTEIANTSAKLQEYAGSLLGENESILYFGYATRTGWAGPRRCFITLTDRRIIILWLKKKYDSLEESQNIPFESINRFTYSLGLALHVPYNQKPFSQRLYIERPDGEVFSFAFDDQNIAKAIYNELNRRLSIFRVGD